MWKTQNDLLSFGDGNTAGNLETTPKAALVGYGVKIFLPSPPNYVTRSPGKHVHVSLENISSMMEGPRVFRTNDSPWKCK